MEQKLNSREKLFLEAKQTYYAGEPIMSDDEFDELEKELREEGSSVISVVGFVDRNLKHKHPSPMLSLSKAQSTVDGKLPLAQMEKWFSTFPSGVIFECTPKFDGNAVNLVYIDGKLDMAISRGDGKFGRNVTLKLKHVPKTISINGTVEVRGEVVMPNKIFYKKYAQNFKNPRNLVAGILSRDDLTADILEDIDFMAIEIRIHDGQGSAGYSYPNSSMGLLEELGFNHRNPLYSKEFKFDNIKKFVDIFSTFKEYREFYSPFQLDGFVIKAQEDIRTSLGETSHHPEWAIAVKFPPKEVFTEVTGFKWNVGTTGTITPIATLRPVDLDGSTIRNVAAFNLGYIMKEKLFPGAKVSIAKSGDIIPQITKVITPGTGHFSHPKNCPQCGSDTEVQGIHLMCSNEDCEGKLFKRFLVGIRILGLDKFGVVNAKLIYDSGIHTLIDLFDETKFNEEEMIASGNFKAGKTLTSLVKEVENLKSIPLFKAIVALGFDKVGTTASKQLAKMMRGQTYSYSGLEKVAVTGFLPGEKKREKVEKFLSILESRGISIEDEIDTSGTVGFEMTGKPNFNFTVKSDLVKYAASKGFSHTGLKDAKYLITDSLNSDSSKMQMALKLGKEVITYEKFVSEILGMEKISLF
jgi:DNA ligase (NAD+)